MVHCVNSGCHREIDDRFNFCPFCGSDNRPPHVRTPVPCMTHHRLPDGIACAICGEILDRRAMNNSGSSRRIWGMVLFGGGFCLAILGGLSGFLPHSWSYQDRLLRWFCYLVFAIGVYMLLVGYCWIKGKDSDVNPLSGETQHRGVIHDFFDLF